MEPYAKRQRIYSPPRREIPLNIPDQHGYYHGRDQPEAYEAPEDVEPIFDPDVELQQRRAQLHGRLKGTFEAIFKKYGRDFEGIADEIDLETGEIVVNNGHLLDMANERDAGLRKLHRQRAVVESEDSIISTDEDQSLDGEEDSEDEDESRGEDEEDGEDEDEDEEDVHDEDEDDESDSGSGSELDMDDDDRLLRGFAQANRFRKASPELGAPREVLQSSELRRQPTSQQHLRSGSLPSPSDIMSQFGPQLGPQIINYISHQEKGPNESHIEPAWRIPGLPAEAFKHNRRPVPVYVASRSEVQRSPSPEASTSIWAISKPDGRRTKYLRNGDQVLNGDHRPIRRTRIRFTEEDDEIMLDWVVKERQRGTLLWSNIMWKSLAAKYPHHTWQSWQIRYRNNFKHVWSNVDSETSDIMGDLPVVQKSDLTPYTGKATLNSTILNEPKRSSRVRQPAKRDSKIMTWSEAVDTLASLDPDLHAGILDDVQEASYVYQPWKLGRSSVPSSQHLGSLRNNLNRPVTSHQMNQSEHSNAQSHKFPYRHLSSQELRPGLLGNENVFHDFTAGAMAPCPHADCKSSLEYMYKLQAPTGKEISDMALHLLDAHNTTPFPCDEANCQRKGKRGYFMQEDLVNHIKAAHPIAAQQRLRGPVDVAPIDQNVEQLRQTIASGSQLVKRGDSRSKNSDLAPHGGMGYVPASSDAHSPSPEQNRMLTPSIYERGSRGDFASTPLTSVSSLKVNRSSALKGTRQEIRDSQGRSSSPMNTKWSVNMNSSDPATNRRSPSLNGRAGEFSRDPFGGLEPFTGNGDSPEFLATGETESMPRSRSVELGSLVATSHLIYLSAQEAMQKSSPKSVASTIATVPNTEGSSFQLSMGSPLASAKKRSGSKSIPQRETFFRNTIDASHEFSDDEGSAEVMTGFDMRPSTSMLPPADSRSYLAKPPTTPQGKKKASEFATQTVVDQDDDLDELSLISDGLAILSSKTKSAAHPPFGSHPRIKREESVDIRLLSVANSRKRKLAEHQDSDEIDELGADECFGKSTGPHTRIKKESDLDGTPLTHRVKAKLKKAATSIDQVKSATGTSTPLLDLDLDRARHASGESGGTYESVSLINPSDTHADSKLLSAAANSSPEENLLTPTSNRGRQNGLTNGNRPEIVVKTPGGTYRRCGDGMFRCGRGFCFRCGVQDIGVQADTNA